MPRQEKRQGLALALGLEFTVRVEDKMQFLQCRQGAANSLPALIP